ncbi:SAP domain-containing protein [Candidatus Poseidoniales archaeon]|nr:SAP domain-containing protein [Candidatus Poseidoniales archaeon]
MAITSEMLNELPKKTLLEIAKSRKIKGRTKLDTEELSENISSKNLTVNELKIVCDKKGLQKTGARDVLVARIWPGHGSNVKSDFEKLTESEAASIFLNMKTVEISLEDLMLDPANPRFHKQKQNLEDIAIPTKENQDFCVEQITEAHGGFEDLRTKMMQFGFVSHENIYVRPLRGPDPVKYVVLEGNRRTACAKHILEDYIKLGVDVDDKPEIWTDSFNTLTCQVYEGDRDDIAWIIQGFRHNGGVKDWDPLRQAKFFVMRMEADDLTETQLADSMGISSSDVKGRTTAYYMLKSANELLTPSKRFPEADSSKSFGWFAESVNKSSPLRKWLGWNASTKKFTNKDHMTSFRDMANGEKEQFKAGQHALAKYSKKLISSDGVATHYWDSMTSDSDMMLDTAHAQYIAEEQRKKEDERASQKTIAAQYTVISKALGELRSPALAGPDSMKTLSEDRATQIRELLDGLKEGIEVWEDQIASKFPPAE